MEGTKNNASNIRLKQLRTRSKLTQKQLAQYLKIDCSMITKLENGTKELNTTLIEKICDLFCCSEEYLMGENDFDIPLHSNCKLNSFDTESLKRIADVNKIIRNIRYMNKIKGE